MTQLTVRSDDQELIERLKKLARREGISLNQAALRLMKKGAGLVEKPESEACVGSALDGFFGTWTDEAADAVGKAADELRTIDESLWR